MSKKLALLGLAVFASLILLPTVLVRGCDWTAPLTPPPPSATLEPALPINVYLEDTAELIVMDLEEYVRGVVIAEMPASFHLEALKAQAVAARTYAVLRMRVFGGAGSTSHPQADISSCSDRAQGLAMATPPAWGRQTAHYAALVERAVQETEGFILVYDDYPIDAVYHSTCGGQTEAAGDVWQHAVPYLVSVPCGHCSHSPRSQHTLTLGVDEIARLLNVTRPGSGLPFSVEERSPTGRVRSVSIPGGSLRGLEFRGLLGLPSTHFTHQQQGEEVHFELQGWGHGVGMCQYGADGLARTGKGYLGILSHYYPGTWVRPIFHE